MSGPRRVRLGMITPSSNTALEPATAAMLRGLPDTSAHFARLRVTEIGLGAAASRQFDMQPMLGAAELLADARCDAICWNGTSGSWLGLEQDRALCEAIRGRVGIPATSASLALGDAFAALEVRRYGLVTPYASEVQEAIVSQLAARGCECVAERHSGLRVNFEFAEVPAEHVDEMIRQAAQPRPEAVVVLCTNMDAATRCARLERETGVAVLDSIAVALWGAMRLAGADTTRIAGYGRLFACR